MSNSLLVLGSQSPRRRELLQMAEIPFEVLVSDVDESFDAETDVFQVPEMLAIRKAHAIQEKFHIKNRWILTADTVVILEGNIIGKPVDMEDAVCILQQLSGKKHTVVSGVCLLKGAEMHTFSDATDVYFNELTEAQIRYFVKKYSPLDKAGAYAIQEWIGLIGVKRIEGCFYNVMGLPVPKIFGMLTSLQ
jgi:septum formation protein